MKNRSETNFATNDGTLNDTLDVIYDATSVPIRGDIFDATWVSTSIAILIATRDVTGDSLTRELNDG